MPDHFPMKNQAIGNLSHECQRKKASFQRKGCGSPQYVICTQRQIGRTDSRAALSEKRVKKMRFCMRRKDFSLELSINCKRKYGRISGKVEMCPVVAMIYKYGFYAQAF